ncbi:hypothetical protein [Oerskovia sp. Root22]|uniref:hypothetical protein n=1 Tax=Oerskovia sp. Root22 TaxID=1736494 RepID=UPI0006F56E37|nr:hypothetical protein [Oerskovia sp. Root22]KRC42971.1 hypothetical protein ASE15_03140 [Oerskovia sp. Root22]
MTRSARQISVRTITTTVTVLIAFTACSSSDKAADDFCATGENLVTALASLDPSDPATSAAALSDVSSQMTTVEVPEDLTTDWKQTKLGVTELAQALEAMIDLDSGDPQYSEKAMTAISVAADTEFQQAKDRITGHISEQCPDRSTS